MSFLRVSDEDIKKGLPTDKYFIWTDKILKEKNVDPYVVAEVTASTWGIFTGLNDVLELLEGVPVDLYAMPEGSIFYPHEPVLTLTGRYSDFAKFETSILGFVCHASGVSTNAFRAKLAAGDKTVFSFGTRRQHPSLVAMLERSAYIGGVDGVSNVAAEKYLGIDSVGTMPHALIISFGGQLEAWKAFDEIVDHDIPRILLVDTYSDEKTETIMAVENVSRVDGVRLDTPGSRKGNIKKIIEEVKWELKIRGREDVKIILSGGLNVDEVLKVGDLVDGFGVGTFISGAGPVDFALDIVERDGVFAAKRGKRGGMKQVIRKSGLESEVRLFRDVGENGLIEKCIEGGKVLKISDMSAARELALQQMRMVREIGVEQEFIC
ncbi:MAG: nicotinate phosphoribosyltransferase [Archaeoglobaceae archaeon]